MIRNYNKMTHQQKQEVKQSFEMAYSSILNQAWLEVRKFVLEFITYLTATVLKRVAQVFFRDEFQEKSGNLSHIHGLIAVQKGDMNNKDLRELVCLLQRNL